MTDIERSGSIHNEELDGEHYLASLLKLASERELVSKEDFKKISDNVNAEISRVIIRSSHGRSSSIRQEVAMTIAESVAFTISVALKKEPTPQQALNRLKSDNMLNIFLDGAKAISTKIKYVKNIYSLIKKEFVSIDNETYNGFMPAIVGFINEYNPHYTAHFTHITGDYPVAINIDNLAGVEYISKYIEAFYYENKFLNYFGAQKIKDLLFEKAASATSVYNVFSTVFRISLLRLISEMPLTGAPLSESDKEDIIDILDPSLLIKARDELYSIIKIKEGGAKKYADFCFENNIIPDLERNGAKAFVISTFG